MDQKRQGSEGKLSRAAGGGYNANTGSRNGYGYGSSYGSGYGYGYGYGNTASDADETMFRRSFQDYVLIFRERIWYIVITFLLIAAGTAVYTFTRVPQFQSLASVEVFRRAPSLMQQQGQASDAQISSVEDLNTQVNILQSEAIVDGVAAGLSPNDQARFLVPYHKEGKNINLRELLFDNRQIVPERLSYIVRISYRHPDRQMAADIANAFADQYIRYNQRLRESQSMQAISELRLRADEQRKKVDDIAAAIQAYREKNNSVSLDQRKDIVTETLKQLNKQVTESSSALGIAETNWNQVETCKRLHQSLLNLPFVASMPTVSKLQQDVAAQRIVVAQLAQRYRGDHPRMMAALSTLNAAEEQLRQAVDTSTSQVEAAYRTAQENYRKAQNALATQEADSLRLDRYGLEYSNLERDYLENEKILEQILTSQIIRQESSGGTIENEIARIVDLARPAKRPSSPRYLLNLTLGGFAGLGVGIAVAFFAAYTDDRVKSAFDIESVVGLPLLGIVPKVSKQSLQDPSGAASDRPAEVDEAFSTILSTLQLRDESKKAQCLLVTSTVAGEGKTFISSMLAQTYAAHGERVVIVDCDLRRPAVNRSFGLENLKGVIDVCASAISLDEVIVRAVRPNLDVIPTGGRSKNPTQLLNGRDFATMISELRKRYDRVFIDTPPVGVVSDAFIILPLVDGSLYSIFFNKVKRRAAKFCAQRVLESNVPCFGAVLNGLDRGIGGYYYSHHYGSYGEYHLGANARRRGLGPKVEEPSKRKSN